MNSTYLPPGHQDAPVPPPPFQPGSGPCGLTTHEWHGFLIFVMLREHHARFGVIRVPPLKEARLTLPTLVVMFVFIIAVIVAWVNSEDISDMWLQATHRVQLTRTGRPAFLATPYLVYIDVHTCSHIGWHDELFKHVLPQRDVGTLITPGPSVNTRSRPAVNFLLAAFFPSMRHRPGS